MQVTSADIVSLTTAQVSTSASVRVVAGNLASVPLGSLLQAVVTQVNPREATLDVGGQSITVRPPMGLQTGAVLFLRVPNSAPGTLDIVAPPRVAKPEVQSVPTGSAQVKVVDVLATLPDGRVQVRIEGQEQTATTRDSLTQAQVQVPLTPGSRQPAAPVAGSGLPAPTIDGQVSLTPGTRVVLEVTQTAAGVVLRAPAEATVLPTAVATAILSATPTNDLTASLKPLQAELAALVDAPVGNGEALLPAPVREAAAAVRETIRTLVPSEPRAPTASDLQNLVENGGIHFESKLARVANDLDPATPPQQAAAEVKAEVKGDLKGDLLRLLQTTRELGIATQLPAARATLEGIEAQQATQTLAQATGTPYIFQIPFPDRDQWRTLHLSVEPENQPGDDTEESEKGLNRFRMLMHVPLSELGETWIDAGLSGDRFRAAIYLDRADVRDRVKAALPELRTELGTDGFGEVLLDVRATADLPKKTRQQSAAMLAGRPASTSLLDVRA